MQAISDSMFYSFKDSVFRLFQNPVIKIKDVQRVCDLSVKASGDLVKAFVEKKLLAEVTGQTRYQIFTFKPYLDLFR